MAEAAGGYRGYIGARPYFGERAAQAVQNLVIRDHCARHGLAYRLSVVEYAMDGCFMMLEQALAELPRLDGLAFYSLLMLPPDAALRAGLVARILKAGKPVHFALEGLVAADETGWARIEDIFALKQMTSAHPAPMEELRPWLDCTAR